MSKIKKSILGIGYFLILSSFISCFVLLWVKSNFGNVSIDQIVDFFSKPLTGISFALIKWGHILELFSVLCFFYLIFYTLKKQKFFLQLLIIIALLVTSVAYTASILFDRASQSVNALPLKLNRYGTEYTLPQLQLINNRNLIIITLESYEKAFASETIFKKQTPLYLKKIQEENLTLSGYKQIEASIMTAYSNIGFFCGGVFDEDILAKNKQKFSQEACFSAFFQNQGYETSYLKAADIRFTATDEFAKQNGFSKAFGYEELKENYQGQEKYSWGLTDFQMYQEAEKELVRLSQTGKPFLMMMQQAGTHSPGDVSKKCSVEYQDIRDAVLCSDKAVGQFLDWLKQQDFYNNTTIVIMGDHLGYFKFQDEELQKSFYLYENKREIYLTILNPAQKLQQKADVFSIADIGASVLDAMGVKFNGRFGYGRSVFRDEPTLLSRYLKENNLILF